MGECGIRGGYAEIINMDPEVMKVLLKSISAIHPTMLGQVVMDVVMNPPRPNEPSYEQFQKEKKETLRSLAERSQLVDTLNSIPGYKVTVLSRNSQRKLRSTFLQCLFLFRRFRRWARCTCFRVSSCHRRRSKWRERRARNRTSSTRLNCWKALGFVWSQARTLAWYLACTTFEPRYYRKRRKSKQCSKH